MSGDVHPDDVIAFVNQIPSNVRDDFELGLEGREFADSKLGQFIFANAAKLQEAAREQLETVDPTDFNEIRKLQNECRIGQLLANWLRDVLVLYENADQIIEQMKQGEVPDG